MEDREGFCYFLPKSKGMDSGERWITAYAGMTETEKEQYKTIKSCTPTKRHSTHICE